MPDFNRWTSNGGDPSLNEINRVDRFFDALGSKETAYSTDHAEADLAFLLADWRDDVRDAPTSAPVTTRDAVAALRGGVAGRRRNRSSLALVTSMAAAVLAIGGFGTAVFSAGPGDALYGVRSALFGHQQVRDDQVALASAELQQVQELVDQGQWQQAQDKLVALSSTVQGVEAPEQKQQLVDQYNNLTIKVVEQDPAATLPPPGEPMPQLPQSPLTLLPPVPDVTVTTTTNPGTPVTTTTPGPEVMLTTTPSESTETSTSTSPSESTVTSTSPSESTPLPTPSAPLPTPSAPLPTPSAPLPTPSTPLPTPTSVPTTTTTTTTVPTRAPEVTSVTPSPQVPVASPPAEASAPAPASESPSRQPQVAPSPVELPTQAPQRPASGGPSGSGQSPETTIIAPAG